MKVIFDTEHLCQINRYYHPKVHHYPNYRVLWIGWDTHRCRPSTTFNMNRLNFAWNFEREKNHPPRYPPQGTKCSSSWMRIDKRRQATQPRRLI